MPDTLTNELAEAIAKSFLKVASSVIPGGVFLESTGEVLLSKFFGITTPKTVEEITNTIAKNMAKRMFASADSLPEKDAPTFRSAVHDFIDAVPKAELSLDTLMATDLDPAKLLQVLMAVPHDPYSSALRQRYYQQLLERFSNEFIAGVISLPGFHVRLVQHLLASIRSIEAAVVK